MIELDDIIEEIRKLGVDVEIVHCSLYDENTDEYKEWDEYSLYSKIPFICERFTENAFRLWCRGFIFGKSSKTVRRSDEDGRI